MDQGTEKLIREIIEALLAISEEGEEIIMLTERDLIECVSPPIPEEVIVDDDYLSLYLVEGFDLPNIEQIEMLPEGDIEIKIVEEAA